MDRPTPDRGIPAATVGCALCRRTLQVVTDDDGVTLTHGETVPAHPPVPVPITQILSPHLLCDHCSDPNPIWAHRTAVVAAVVIDGPIHRIHDFGNSYAACPSCATLIARGDRRGLLARATAAYETITGAALGGPARAGLVRLQASFWANLEPGRTPITTAPPTPAPPIRAAQLPKVRDRLRDWWTGDQPPRTATLALAGRWPLPPHLAAGDTDDRAAIAAHVDLLAASLEAAALYWIDPQFCDLALQAARSLPGGGIAREQVPTDDGLLVWARPVGVETVFGGDVTAAHWMRVPDGWWITFAAATGASLAEPALQALRTAVGWLHPTGPGLLLPDPYAGGRPDHPWLATLIATWALIDQPLSATTDTPAERGIRRAYARTGRTDPPVRVVSIAPRRRGQASAGEPAAAARAYSHRWWVSGFWRRQHYGPANTRERLIFITGHLAGPDDKPVRLRPTVHVLGRQNTPPTDGHPSP